MFGSSWTGCSFGSSSRQTVHDGFQRFGERFGEPCRQHSMCCRALELKLAVGHSMAEGKFRKHASAKLGGNVEISSFLPLCPSFQSHSIELRQRHIPSKIGQVWGTREFTTDPPFLPPECIVRTLSCPVNSTQFLLHLPHTVCLSGLLRLREHSPSPARLLRDATVL